VPVDGLLQQLRLPVAALCWVHHGLGERQRLAGAWPDRVRPPALEHPDRAALVRATRPLVVPGGETSRLSWSYGWWNMDRLSLHVFTEKVLPFYVTMDFFWRSIHCFKIYNPHTHTLEKAFDSHKWLLKIFVFCLFIYSDSEQLESNYTTKQRGFN